MNNILVFGGTGKLGSNLVKKLKIIDNFDVKAPLHTDFADITKYNSIKNSFPWRQWEPDVIINCAAYINVDKAEIEKDLCYNINTKGVKNLIKLANKYDAKLIQISTDYVYDDESYKEPLNFYGWTKLWAEQLIEQTCNNYYIIRTAGLYSSDSKFNSMPEFIYNMKKPAEFIDDAYFNWTNVETLSNYIVNRVSQYDITGSPKNKIVNVTDSGLASPYEFVQEMYAYDPCLGHFETDVTPITFKDYLDWCKENKNPHANRISESPFQYDKDTVKGTMDWKTSLKQCMEEIKREKYNR